VAHVIHLPSKKTDLPNEKATLEKIETWLGVDYNFLNIVSQINKWVQLRQSVKCIFVTP
jgi:hypothetical protein